MADAVSETVFEVSQDDSGGGYSASAVGYGIHTEGDTLEQLRRNVREAVECYFGLNQGIEVTPTENGLLIRVWTAAEHPVDRVYAILGKSGRADAYLEEVRGR
ncbi:MAG: hypothetical protein J4F32_01855 [Dehalococcoidia bacterium]|nr:hypothetical protein [Dehalococcoidia bacterium]